MAYARGRKRREAEVRLTDSKDPLSKESKKLVVSLRDDLLECLKPAYAKQPSVFSIPTLGLGKFQEIKKFQKEIKILINHLEIKNINLTPKPNDFLFFTIFKLLQCIEKFYHLNPESAKLIEILIAYAPCFGFSPEDFQDVLHYYGVAKNTLVDAALNKIIHDINEKKIRKAQEDKMIEDDKNTQDELKASLIKIVEDNERAQAAVQAAIKKEIDSKKMELRLTKQQSVRVPIFLILTILLHDLKNFEKWLVHLLSDRIRERERIYPSLEKELKVLTHQETQLTAARDMLEIRLTQNATDYKNQTNLSQNAVKIISKTTTIYTEQEDGGNHAHCNGNCQHPKEVIKLQEVPDKSARKSAKKEASRIQRQRADLQCEKDRVDSELVALRNNLPLQEMIKNLRQEMKETQEEIKNCHDDMKNVKNAQENIRLALTSHHELHTTVENKVNNADNFIFYQPGLQPLITNITNLYHMSERQQFLICLIPYLPPVIANVVNNFFFFSTNDAATPDKIKTAVSTARESLDEYERELAVMEFKVGNIKK